MAYHFALETFEEMHILDSPLTAELDAQKEKKRKKKSMGIYSFDQMPRQNVHSDKTAF